MAEQTREEQYIKCSRCQMKYINNDDHIKKEFGYNRLNERYKTCIACRENRKQYRKSKAEELKTYKHKYWIDHKDDIKKKREQLMKDADESDGRIKYCNRCYQNKNIDQFVCPNGKIYNACCLGRTCLSSCCRISCARSGWIFHYQQDPPYTQRTGVVADRGEVPCFLSAGCRMV